MANIWIMLKSGYKDISGIDLWRKMIKGMINDILPNRCLQETKIS